MQRAAGGHDITKCAVQNSKKRHRTRLFRKRLTIECINVYSMADKASYLETSI